MGPAVETGSTKRAFSLSDSTRWIGTDRQCEQLYFVLVDAPYPDDGVPSSGEEPVQRRVQLEGIDPVAVVLLHLISNDIGHLEHRHTEI